MVQMDFYNACYSLSALPQTIATTLSMKIGWIAYMALFIKFSSHCPYFVMYPLPHNCYPLSINFSLYSL